MTDYVKANDALVQQTATVMSVEATIAQRRLQEEYCLRFVRCSLDDQTARYLEFNSTAASRTKRWKNTTRYRLILIEPTAGVMKAASGRLKMRFGFDGGSFR
jgi:hypothetical protein